MMFTLLLFCKYHNIDPDSLVRLKHDQIKTIALNHVIHLKALVRLEPGLYTKTGKPIGYQTWLTKSSAWDFNMNLHRQ
jgi:hypothetical protein